MTQKDIQVIVFDFGGVLIKWDPRQIFKKFFPDDPQAVETFMEEIGFAEWNLRQDAGYPFPQAVADLSARFPQYAHIIQDYDTSWEESITGIIPETVEIVNELKQRGYPLYGLTNWNLDKFKVVRRRYDFFDYFEEIIISGEVKLAKPDPAIFRLLLQRIDRQPTECLMIDDSAANVETCRQLGFHAIHFSSPVQLEEELIRLNVF